ncbi:MAG: hypothetical protein U9Q69_06350 [Nanoarchaeota archaeon]|nr:hypothetical protein [Nanoarchaeota archaeon]
MKLFKKGDLNIRYIVLIILGLMVLIIIALIFSKSSTSFLSKLKDIWNQIIAIKPDLTGVAKK